MQTFQGIDHEVQRLYVHWDITTKCNYHCNYCYSWQDYENQRENNWNKEMDKEVINKIITSLSISTLPVFLGLLGGEPTISKYYFYILEELKNKVLFKKDRNRLYITTNLSKNLEWWKEHPKLERTFILASFHPEYFKDENDINIFIEKLNYLVKYFKVKVNIMLDDKYQDILKILESKLDEIDSRIIIHPHIIYPDGSPFNDPKTIYKNIDIYKNFYSKQIPVYEFNSNPVTDHEVFTKDIYHFKDWKCYQNNYEIDIFGNIQNICFNEQLNIKNNILFFKNLKEIKARKCPHNNCSCDGLLNCKKVKE